MKKRICAVLSVLLIFALAACGSSNSGNNAGAAKEWTRSGYYINDDEYMLSVVYMDDVDEPGWYVGCMLGEDPMDDSWGGMVTDNGDSLSGTLPCSGEGEDITVTVTEDGEDGLALAIEGGDTYRFKVWDIPEAAISIYINTEGWGNIAYAEGEEAPEIDTDYPFQSSQVNLAEPTMLTVVAWPDTGNKFVKWTKNGEDYSEDAQITFLAEETAEYVAVFEEDPDWQNPVMNFVGNYGYDKANATVSTMGFDEAFITIQWPVSAGEIAQWDIAGKFDPETATVNYEGCTKSIITFDENNEVASQEPEYEDGTGTIVFDEGSFTWHEDQSGSDEAYVFNYYAPLSE